MKDIFNELSKIQLEEIKINTPVKAFKINIPKEWEEKTIQNDEEFNKFLLDFYSFNTKFFSYLSDEIGGDIKEYITSVISDYLYKEYPMNPTLVSFDIVKEGIWYYFIKLGINKIPIYNTDVHNEFDNLLVKQFDKRLINLDLVKDFFKANISEVKSDKPKPSVDPIPLHVKYSILPELKKLIEYTNQDTLNPNVFDGLEVKPKVREVLLKIANYFWDSLELNQEYQDVLLLGSSANYNWTENSDIDIHILFDFRKSGQKPEDFKKYIDTFVQNFNTTYEFKIKNNEIQMYVQNITEENHSIGVFSLLNNKWVQDPIKDKVEVPDSKIQEYSQIFKFKIDELLNSSTEDLPAVLDKIKQLKEEVKDFRQKGLDSTEGEYSIENLVFKELRNSGYLEKLYNWKTEVLNQKLSINEAKNIGKLYHFTGILQLAKIIEDNALKPILDMSDEKTYISFTRNQYFYKEPRYSVSTQCRIVVDGNKLSSKYKLTPYSDPEYSFKGHEPESEADPFEYEERVQTKAVENLDNFVLSYDIFLKESLKTIETAWQSLDPKDFEFIVTNKKIRVFKSKEDLVLIPNKEAFDKISSEILYYNEIRNLNEGKQEDVKQNIIELSKFLKEKLELPYLPKVKFINNDSENANNPLGRTAYYDPNTKNIVLYTLGRHPKDITRSFSHEIIHFKQDLEDRLNNIYTQNVNEDEYLAELEREAYEKGNMLLRSWENSKNK
jgi:hypothetical protein